MTGRRCADDVCMCEQHVDDIPACERCADGRADDIRMMYGHLPPEISKRSLTLASSARCPCIVCTSSRTLSARHPPRDFQPGNISSQRAESSSAKNQVVHEQKFKRCPQ